MGKLSMFLALMPFCVVGVAQEDDAGASATPEAQQMQQMEVRMRSMHEQMAQIHATEDPQERKRLMQEHMQSMHQGMAMMGQMMNGSRDTAGGCADSDTSCRLDRMQTQQQMLRRQMGMMQQMMEQMMQQMMQGQTDDSATAEDHATHH